MGRSSRHHHWILLALRPLLVSVPRNIFISIQFSNSRRRCITARRRRRAGRQPFYGTGWASRPGQNGAQNTAQPYYNNQYNNTNQPAPPYSAQPQNGYYGGGANQGYYGGGQQYGQPQYGQQQGVELQSPQATYHRGDQDAYAPPAGPPPGKDGIIR